MDVRLHHRMSSPAGLSVPVMMRTTAAVRPIAKKLILKNFSAGIVMTKGLPA